MTCNRYAAITLTALLATAFALAGLAFAADPAPAPAPAPESAPAPAAEEHRQGAVFSGRFDNHLTSEQNTSPRRLLSLSLNADVFSEYVWRGLLLTDGPILQPCAKVTYRGLSLSVWGNMDLDNVNDNKNEFNEIDYTLSYSVPVNILTFTAGVLHYDFPNTEFLDTTEIIAGVSAALPLSPSITSYWDVDAVKGVYVTADLAPSFPLPAVSSSFTWSIDPSIGLGWGTDKHNNFYYGTDTSTLADFHTGLSVPFHFGDHFTIAPKVGYASLLDGTLRNDVAHPDNFWFGVGITIGF